VCAAQRMAVGDDVLAANVSPAGSWRGRVPESTDSARDEEFEAVRFGHVQSSYVAEHIRRSVAGGLRRSIRIVGLNASFSLLRKSWPHVCWNRPLWRHPKIFRCRYAWRFERSKFQRR